MGRRVSVRRGCRRGVARVPCQLFDRVKTYAVGGHLAASIVNESVGRIRSLRNVSGSFSNSFELRNHVCERLVGIHQPAAVVARCVPVALGFGKARDGALKPDPFRCGAGLDKCNRGWSAKAPSESGFGQPVTRGRGKSRPRVRDCPASGRSWSAPRRRVQDRCRGAARRRQTFQLVLRQRRTQ